MTQPSRKNHLHWLQLVAKITNSIMFYKYTIYIILSFSPYSLFVDHIKRMSVCVRGNMHKFYFGCYFLLRILCCHFAEHATLRYRDVSYIPQLKNPKQCLEYRSPINCVLELWARVYALLDKVLIIIDMSEYIRWTRSARYAPRGDANELIIDDHRTTAITLKSCILLISIFQLISCPK